MVDLVSDSEQVEKVKDEHEKGLVICLQKIKQWEKYKDDYEALQECLKTLPDKLAYNIMVPFGACAFMPGTLVQTNNVTVLLGDNWFANVSAKQAAGIVGRRIKQCSKMLEDLHKEKKQFENWLGFISDVADEKLVEIKEEYDPEKEKLWREQHRKNVQEYRKKNSQEKNSNTDAQRNEASTEEDAKIKSFEDYFSRLSELENEEEEEDDDDEEDHDISSSSDEAEEEDIKAEYENFHNKEVSTSEKTKPNALDNDTTNKENNNKVPTEIKMENGNIDTTVSNDDNKNGSDQKRHVRWIDLSEAKSKKITFTHSTIKSTPPKKKHHRRRRRNSSTSEVEEEDTDEKTVLINSPSDIYKCFSYTVQHSKPKSILKMINTNSVPDNTMSSLDSTPSEEACMISNGVAPKIEETSEIDSKVELCSNEQSSLKTAFTGEVQECSKNELSVNANKESRPKSLFKSSRSAKS